MAQPSVLLALLSAAVVGCMLLLNVQTHHQHHQHRLMQRDASAELDSIRASMRINMNNNNQPRALLQQQQPGGAQRAAPPQLQRQQQHQQQPQQRPQIELDLRQHPAGGGSSSSGGRSSSSIGSSSSTGLDPQTQRALEAALDERMQDQQRLLREQMAMFLNNLQDMDKDNRERILGKLMDTAAKNEQRLASLEDKLDRVQTEVSAGIASNGEKIDRALQQLKDIRQQADALGEQLRHYAEANGHNEDAHQQQGPTPPPEPNVPMLDFIQLVQQHLVGDITHAEFETALGINATGTAEVLGWPSLDSPAAAAADQGAEGNKVKEHAHSSHMLDRFPSRIISATLANSWCVERNESGDNFVLNHCPLGGVYQHWAFDALGRLQTAYDKGRCLDASGLGPGDHLVASRCSKKAAAQRWHYVKPGSQSQAGYLVNKDTKLCMGAVDVLQPWNASLAPRVVMQACDASCTQLWSVSDNVTTTDDLMPSADTARAMLNHRAQQLAEAAKTGTNLGLIYEREAWHARGEDPLAERKQRRLRRQRQHQQQEEEQRGDRKGAGEEELGQQGNGMQRRQRDRIACWVMTNPKNHQSKALAINSTWGRDCDLLLFMTTKHHAGLNTIVLSLGEEEDRHFLWRKSIMSWGFMYTHLLDNYDWFMRADDDTFLNMDNLRSFLKGYSPDDPHFFGRRLKIDNDEFYSGGGGTILSHNALQQLGNAMKDDIADVIGDGDTFADDMEIARSMRRLGIPTEDTRDEQGRERFFVLTISHERNAYRAKDPDFWYFQFSYYPPREGEDSSSPWWIASHYMSPPEMLLTEAVHNLKCEAAGEHPWKARVQS